ncbi:hypothetical protein POX_b02029 [Penicillium oxalicum]|nr:hypothetical protein POX_b02029 [Penicillium oxalicum]KAI2791998.1 hypothetical protein POX_b02029 [Penicillium oxalicum]
MADRQQPIKTLFLVISDMHGLKKLARDTLNHSVDVVILCGDLSTDSEFEEYKASISFLRTINAPLKIAIAGNHDFTMDIATFRRKVAYVKPPLNPSLVQQVYGYGGEARNLFDRQAGNTFLNE